MAAQPGSPRSTAELRFFAGMRPCEVCQSERAVDWQIGGSGTRWRVHGRCPRCSAERSYEFECADDLVRVRAPDGELGGREPSTIIDPFAFMQDIDRVAPTILIGTGRLAPADWHANYDRLERVQVALAELAKFIPDGASEVPQTALADELGQADRRARPERYTRTWIDSELARWLAVAAELAPDAARVEPQPVAARGTLDAASLAAHRAWWQRGQTGAGRLELAGALAEAAQLVGCELAGARFEHVELGAAQLDRADLAKAELRHVDLAGARLAGARLHGASLADCMLDRANLADASLGKARLERCSFVDATLERTTWGGATLFDCTLRGARFAGATWTGAELSHCDLRGAWLAGAIPRGAVFEHCDLRGLDLDGLDLADVRFVHCKLGGVTGHPSSTAGWVVIAADLSLIGDGSSVGDYKDLLRYLG